MADMQRGALARIESSFSLAKSNLWNVTVPFIIISLSYSLLTSVAIPLFPKTAATFALVVLSIIGVFLSFAVSVGTYSEILRPSAPCDSFSPNAVSDFFKRSWTELRKVLFAYYYVIEYSILVPALLAFVAILCGSFVLGAFGTFWHADRSWSALPAVATWLGVIAMFAVIALILYRNTRCAFPIIHAVSVWKSDRESFREAVSLTDGKWWAIFGNFFVLCLVCFSAMALISLGLTIILDSFPVSKAVKDFVVGAPGVLVQIMMTFFSYELYRDYSEGAKTSDDIFVP